MAQAPTKNPLKDKLNDDELDLSISGYKDKEVPVKDIALLKRATKLDLSNNKLTGLPKSFATLTHLVKLDLSCNVITELPSNFGELTRLKHLDLYNNRLTHLPLSFHQLTSLRWLDLKNNSLSPQLAGAAGECLNPRECELCAKRVVAFMARVKEHYDQERIRREQAEKELQSAKQAAEDAERERARLEKKAKKEQRKLELQERRRIENLTAHAEPHQPEQQQDFAKKQQTGRDVYKVSVKPRWSSLARLNVLLLLTALALAASTIYIHARGDVSRSGLRTALDRISANLATLGAAVRHRTGSFGDAVLNILSGVSYIGAYAGDLLVDKVVATYEWGLGRADELDRYMLSSHGDTWRSAKATAATALQTAGRLGRAAAERALVLTVLAVQKGGELAADWGAAAWDASGPLWEATLEAGSAVKAGVLAAAARLRDEGGPALLHYAAQARDAAGHALHTLRTEGPGYAAAAWQAAARAAAAAYESVSALWSPEAPSYTERLSRLVSSVTGG